MRPQVQQFFAALTYFTRLPSPSWVELGNVRGAACFAPLMGWIVGAVAAVTFAAAYLVFPISIAILVSMGASVWITGAIHEDGWADFCDGFGGGRDAEQTLEIMRDSRCGAFGVIGLVLMLLLKYVALLELGAQISATTGGAGLLWLLMLTFLTGHSLSRFAAVSFMRSHEYISGRTPTKAQSMANRMSRGELRLAATAGLIPLLALALMVGPSVLLVLPWVWLVRYAIGRMFTQRLGGYTGDCLGAVQQATEVVIYLSFYAVLAI